MADDKEKIAKLEERLDKAAATFKEMKVQLDDKVKENETLKTRIAELEDELTLNGGAVEEVEGLKGRLEKAKEIFNVQKAKIAELNASIAEKDQTIVKVQTNLASAKEEAAELSQKIREMEGANNSLKGTIEQIKEIVSCYN